MKRHLPRYLSLALALFVALGGLSAPPKAYSGPIPAVPEDAPVLYIGVVACPGGDLRTMVDYDLNKDGEVDLRIFASMDGEPLAYLSYVPTSNLPTRVAITQPNKLGVFDIDPTNEDLMVRMVCSPVKPAV